MQNAKRFTAFVLLSFADCVGVTPLAVPLVQLATSYKNFTVKFHK